MHNNNIKRKLFLDKVSHAMSVQTPLWNCVIVCTQIPFSLLELYKIIIRKTVASFQSTKASLSTCMQCWKTVEIFSGLVV